MMKKNYPTYRDSGFDWLAHIPEKWQIKRAKWVFREVDFRSESGNEELLSVSEYFGVIKRKNANVNMFKAASYIGYKLCNPGDLVINSLWAWSRGLGFSKYHGIVSTAYGVYRPNPNEVGDYQYFHYLLRTKMYVGQYAIRSKGIWISRLQLSDKNFLDIPVLIPPKEEQTAIARFLDYKLAKINRFIQKKKQLIKLLNEQKAAIINQAVTKGIKSTDSMHCVSTKMKDSGIEWLGEIPEHWEVRKLKYDGKIKSGDGITSNEIEEKGNYEVYGGNGFIGFANKFNVEGENLIIGRVGAKCGNVHFINSKKFISDNALILTLNPGLNYTYYSMVLEVSNLNTLNTSSAQPLITGTKVMNYPIPIAPKKEQQQIVYYIEQETTIINTTISKIEKEIALVEEYKTALIAEAVTGKIDVRGYEIPEITEEETYEEIEEEISMAAEDEGEYENAELEE